MTKPKTALVVGAGPAGLSAALGLLAEGIPTAIVERHSQPIPRVCGAFLSAEALAHLASLNLCLAAQERGVPVSEVRLFLPRGTERILPLAAAGLALERDSLEDLMREAVLRQGGTILSGVTARPGSHPQEILQQGPGLSPSAPSRAAADAVVWADGRFSGMRNTTGLYYGWNARFQDVPQAPGGLSLFFYPGGYVGALTFADGSTNLCGLHRRTSIQDWESIFKMAQDRCPALAKLLALACRVSPWRGAGPLPFTAGVQYSPGRLAVGDASGVGDPFFGEGIGRALSAGPLLRQAVRTASTAETLFRLQRRAYRGRFLLGALTRRLLPYLSRTDIFRWMPVAPF